MKKIIVIILVILVILIGALLAIPIFFKQNLIDVAKNTMNQQLNAEVEFADLKISLFRNFPQATVEFKDVLIKGKGEFKSDTLLNVALVRTKMDLSSLFKKSEMSIEEIILEKPIVNLLVAESGNVNWDVAPAEEPKPAAVKSSGSETDEFQLQLEKIEIKNARLKYNDKEAQMKMEFSDVNFDVSGSMYGNSTQLKTDGSVEDFSLTYGNVNYISKTRLGVHTMLNVDFDQLKFTITENELLINRLPLELSGSIEMPGDTIGIDLQLKTKESDFENFLALVPPVYESYLKDIVTTGSASISGGVSGFYFGDNYPVIDLKMLVADGNFQYADLPEKIKNITADVSVTKPQGDFDLTQIKVNEAHAEIRNNPVDLTLKVLNPVSDPYFDGVFIGKINLSHLKDALPIDSVDISGVIDANLFAKGNYSDVEAEAYDKIKSDGIVLLDNFIYESPDLTQKIIVPKGQLDFSPESINLRAFNMNIGRSDFRLTGKVSNYLNYFLKDGVLKGNLQLNSQMVNLNELLRLQVEKDEEIAASSAAQNTATEGETVEEAVLAFDVPDHVDITFNSDIKMAVFDRLPITNIKGSIRAVNKKLLLDNMNMNMLDGELKMNGSYQNTPNNQPLFDLGFDISSFDIPLMYQTLSGVRSIMPVASNSTGQLSSTLGMKGRLSPQFKLIPSTANGTGMLNTKNLELKDSPIFNQLGGILKKEKLRNVKVDDFKANFTVQDGNLVLKPFTTRVIGQETQITGSLSAESLLDMRFDFNVERELFGSDIQKILSVIPGNQNISMLPAGVLIKGPVGGPKVSMDLSATQKAVTEATKDDLKKTIDKLGQGLKKLFN
ncbi:AsmA family protein [Prolixibacteraceae bacterium Z1-6]|uniref:AsmA family protein n=1 Tax=Draconibacterium aestuarii TaxID=2998507 RepID=A0A9X3F899_9BACT|nr:AsmA family protein [Prolixibacteraceae bacterium Z1-6]